MRQTLILLILMFYSLTAFSQNPDFNLELVGNLDYDVTCNEVWGYVDPTTGIEYALMGTNDFTAIISLEDPTNPTEIYRVDGGYSDWKDLKTYGSTAYVVCDNCNEGLWVIDLSDMNNISYELKYEVPDMTNDGSMVDLIQFHNLFVDERGYLYACGGPNNSGGTVIFDVHTDPLEPVIVGYGRSEYAHDIYVRNGIIYNSNIYEGAFSIEDATDVSDIKLLSSQKTTGDFTHNAWLSDDGEYLFTTDEIPNGAVESYFVGDPQDIKRLDVFRPVSTLGQGVIVHNTHVFGQYLVTSWYTDGVKILDSKYPDNLIEVASFDTYQPDNVGFYGCWGAYPWLPSGLVLASDRQTGLYVLQPDYIKPSYLSGVVQDLIYDNAIPDATIEILSSYPNQKFTNNRGQFKSGIPSEGRFTIKASHPYYHDTTVTIDLFSDSIVEVTMHMRPIALRTDIEVLVEDANHNPIPFAPISMKTEFGYDYFWTDGNGRYSDFVFDLTYEIGSGSWGYGDTLITVSDLSSPIVVTLPGTGILYRDRFIIDQYWAVTTTATSGIWERGVPESTEYQGVIYNAPEDSPWDIGDQCYATGLSGGDPFEDDLELRKTNTLVSQPIILSVDHPEVRISFDYWFQAILADEGVTPLLVYLTFDNQDVPDILVAELDNYDSNWQKFSSLVDIKAVLDQGASSMRLKIVAERLKPAGQEAGVDNIDIEILGLSSTDNPRTVFTLIAPNPFHDRLYIMSDQVEHVEMYDMNGRRVLDVPMTSEIDTKDLIPGIYILKWSERNGSLHTSRVAKF